MEINKFTLHTVTQATLSHLQRLSPWSWASVFGFWCIANCFLLLLSCTLCACLLLFVDFNNYFMVSQFKKLWWKREIGAIHWHQAAFKINFFPYAFSFFNHCILTFFKYSYVDNILHFNCGFFGGQHTHTSVCRHIRTIITLSIWLVFGGVLHILLTLHELLLAFKKFWFAKQIPERLHEFYVHLVRPDLYELRLV